MSCSLANFSLEGLLQLVVLPLLALIIPFWKIMCANHNLKQHFRWRLKTSKNYIDLASHLLLGKFKGLGVSLKDEQTQADITLFKILWQYNFLNN